MLTYYYNLVVSCCLTQKISFQGVRFTERSELANTAYI